MEERGVGGGTLPPHFPLIRKARSIPHQGHPNTSSLLESSSSNRHRKSRSQQVGGGTSKHFFIAPFPFAELRGLNLLLLSVLGVKAEVMQVKFLHVKILSDPKRGPMLCCDCAYSRGEQPPDKGTHSLCSRSFAMMCWFWSAAFTSFATWVLALSRFSVTQETFISL